MLKISNAPHARCAETTQSLMRDVLIALLPTTIAGICYFGVKAALLVVICVITAVLTEYAYQKITKQPIRVGDLSAAVTGLILALNLPATAPWWMAVVGSVIAIALVKQLFGGIGDNFLNPALAARGILLASWPVRMTSYVLPGVDAVSSATVLSGSYSASTADLFMGNIPGTIGEVCKLAILIGFAYMVLRKMICWGIPVVFLASTALFSLLFGADPLAAILSGGVMFGAVFMATDYVTSPMFFKGQMIYAAGCGLIVAVIRNFGAYPEGVTYAILLMNIATPLLDKYMKPKVYGIEKPKKAKEAQA